MVAVETYEPDAPTPSPLDRPVEERGETDIQSSAFAHLAERTAHEVPGVHGVRGGGLPLIGSDGADEARHITASADVLPSRRVTIDLTVAVDYPAPVNRIVNELRTYVIEQIEAVTGYRVARLDIDVAELSRAAPRRRVV